MTRIIVVLVAFGLIASIVGLLATIVQERFSDEGGAEAGPFSDAQIVVVYDGGGSWPYVSVLCDAVLGNLIYRSGSRHGPSVAPLTVVMGGCRE